MLEARISSNGKRAFDFIEQDDGTVVVRIHSLLESLHYIGVALAARNAFRSERIEEHDLRLEYGPLKVNVG